MIILNCICFFSLIFSNSNVFIEKKDFRGILNGL